MDKTTIAKIFSVSLVLLLLSISVPLAKGYHVSVTWGSTYHPTQNDPDPDWYWDYEQPAQSYTVSYIASLVPYAGANWAGNNFYGSSTTASNVYQCSSSVQSSGSYDFLATFHVGDMYPKFVDGGYWAITDYYWDDWLQEWVPIWEWVYTGTTRHYAYYGSQGSSNGIEDLYLYSHTGWKHKFTFIWTCANGGLIDRNSDGYYDCYGYVDTDYGTGIVGMPYAWTQRTDLSMYGYSSPDSSGYAYIGFENVSKYMSDNSEFYSYNYGDFCDYFYYYALVQHYSINTALNCATTAVLGQGYTFADTWLYNGYWTWDNEHSQWWKCYMRVIGDGNMYLPT